MKKDNENLCRRCYHDKRGIYHKVFSSCAKHKHKTYNFTNLYSNYISKLPNSIEDNDYYNNVYLDDLNIAEKTGNEFLQNLLINIKINIERIENNGK